MADRHESTVVCFSCEESGHAASRCPVLDNLFPFLPPVWQVDRTDDGFILWLTVIRRETSSYPGRGVNHPDQ